MRKKKLGEILIESELITEEQLENALTIQQGKNKKLGKVLIELGYVDEMQVAETLTKQLKLQMVNCNDYSPPKEVLALVSKTTAEQRLVLPLELNGGFYSKAEPARMQTGPSRPAQKVRKGDRTVEAIRRGKLDQQDTPHPRIVRKRPLTGKFTGSGG